MNDKKNCIVLYYKSTESWLDKIPKNINVLKKIELKEDDTIENINEKIKDNFCVYEHKTNENQFIIIEAIIFLCNSEKINIKELFDKNNFALFLPSIIQVKEQDKLEQIKISDKNTKKNIKNNNFLLDSLDNQYGLDNDLNPFINLLEDFQYFFNQMHKSCDNKIGCKIKNIDQYYKDYNYELISSKDVKDVFDKMKLIRNVFGFFQITEEKEFISHLEYIFKYNIIINSLVLLRIKNIPTNTCHFNGIGVNNYIIIINKWCELTKEKKEKIRQRIFELKLKEL